MDISNQVSVEDVPTKILPTGVSPLLKNHGPLPLITDPLLSIQTAKEMPITSLKPFLHLGFRVEVCQKARSETEHRIIGKWFENPQRTLKNTFVFLMVYIRDINSYIMDTNANPDSADTSWKSMRKSGFPCLENFSLIILICLKTFSDMVKLNLHYVFAR